MDPWLQLSTGRERRQLADTLTDVLAALPPAPGTFDSGLRRRFTDASAARIGSGNLRGQRAKAEAEPVEYRRPGQSR